MAGRRPFPAISLTRTASSSAAPTWPSAIRSRSNGSWRPKRAARPSFTSTRGSPARARSPDTHVASRVGGDIVLIGALVNHVLSGGHEFREYVTSYTNAADILPEDFSDTEESDGLFSGYDPITRTYDNASWQPTGERDLTLTHPRCVFQVLTRHSPGTPRSWWNGSAASARPTSESLPTSWFGAAGGTRPRPGCTRSAGRSTPPACSTSAAPRSCSCCWVTWAGPAAGSWRCAVMPASRARLTSRRCSTCSPATCQCRGPRTTAWPATWPGCLTPGSGATSALTWSACSRPGSAMRRRRRTSTACR